MKKAFNVLKIKRRTAIFLFCTALLALCCVSASVARIVFATCEAITQGERPLPYPLQTQPPYTVAIDPGHGNFDIGGSGVIKELSVIDKTAKYLSEWLSSDESYTLVLTREPTQDPKIAQRAELVNNAKASLLLSLHANSDKSAPEARGFECFPTPPGRLYSEQSLRIAQILVDKMRAAGHKIRGETGIKFAYYNGKSKSMVDSSNIKIRTQKSFGIVEKPLCPSVLIEQCFISNSSDAVKWGSDEGCKAAARVYYEAICEYFGTIAKEKP